MLEKITGNFIFICIIGLIAWVSFIPEPLQARYLGIVKIYLWVILLASLVIHRFRIYDFFFKGSGKYIWAYLLLLLVGLINPVDKILARDFYINLAALSVPIYFILRNEINESNLKKVLLCFVIFAFIVAIIGILEILFGRSIIYEKYIANPFYKRYITQKRAMATLIHPNILGCYLVSMAPLAYFLYYSAKAKVQKIIYFFIFIIIITVILLTFSRGSWIAGLLTISIYSIYMKKYKLLAGICIAFFIFSMTISFFPHSALGYRFGPKSLIKQVSNDHRIAQYYVTFNMLKKHPFIGIGLNNYRKVFDIYSEIKMAKEVKIPDSIYLMHLAEAGIIGFSGFMILLFSIIKQAILFLKKHRNSNEIYLFISLSFFAILLNMAFFDGFLWHTPFYLFWIFAGILASVDLKKENIP